MATKTANRTQLTNVVDLHVAPARVRRYIDKCGMNREVTNLIDQEKTALLVVQKEGAPAVLERPSKPAADASAEVLAAYETAMTAYHASLSAYKKFRSTRYEELDRVYNLTKDLAKMQVLLRKKEEVGNQPAGGHPMKKKFTQKNGEKLAAMVTAATTTYPQELKGVTLSSSAAVQTLLKNLHTKYPTLVHFGKRDELSSTRRRFNERAQVALSTVLESIVVEITEHSMRATIASGKKTVHRDHCLSEGFESLPLHALYSNLPVYRALRSREDRRREYEYRTSVETDKAKAKAKFDAKLRGKGEKPAEVPAPVPFNQREVEGGFALAPTEEGGSHQWYNLDVRPEGVEAVDQTDFVTYVDSLTKSMKTTAQDAGNTDVANLLIGSDMRHFLSDIIIQFIARILPQISLTISFKKNDIKTICDQTIMYEVRKFLVDSSHNVRGDVTFTPGQTQLFNNVAQKMTLLDNFNKKENTTAASQPSATSVATPATTTTTTTPAPATDAATPAEKSGPKRRTKQ